MKKQKLLFIPLLLTAFSLFYAIKAKAERARKLLILGFLLTCLNSAILCYLLIVQLLTN